MINAPPFQDGVIVVLSLCMRHPWGLGGGRGKGTVGRDVLLASPREGIGSE